MVSKMFKWWIINDQEAIGYCALVLQFSFYSSYLIRYKLKLLNPGIQRDGNDRLDHAPFDTDWCGIFRF